MCVADVCDGQVLGATAGSEPSSSVRVTRGAPCKATCVIL